MVDFKKRQKRWLSSILGPPSMVGQYNAINSMLVGGHCVFHALYALDNDWQLRHAPQPSYCRPVKVSVDKACVSRRYSDRLRCFNYRFDLLFDLARLSASLEGRL
jgi:hypothetical protein